MHGYILGEDSDDTSVENTSSEDSEGSARMQLSCCRKLLRFATIASGHERCFAGGRSWLRRCGVFGIALAYIGCSTALSLHLGSCHFSNSVLSFVLSSISLLCWLIFDCLRVESSKLTRMVSCSLLLTAWQMLVKLSLQVVADLPIESAMRWAFISQALNQMSAAVCSCVTLGAFQHRIELVEDAFAERLWSCGIRVVRICFVVVYTVCALAWVVAGVAAEEYHASSLAAHRDAFRSTYEMWVSHTNPLEFVGWIAVGAFATRSLGAVSKSARVPKVKHVSTFVLAEAAWARVVIRRALLASIALPCVAVALVVANAVMDRAIHRDSPHHFARCIYYLRTCIGMCTMAFLNIVEFLAWLGVLGCFRPTLPAINVHQDRALPYSSEASKERGAAWRAKVRELAERSMSVCGLLEFHALLGSQSVMPHYDPWRHTTNDVVRGAIVPLSRHGHAGRSYADARGTPFAAAVPVRMVTHEWQNLFVHLVAAVVADALGLSEYRDIAELLAKGLHAHLRHRLEDASATQHHYWICAFCVNQHASICNGFGHPPPAETPDFARWDANRRDTVTRVLHPPCTCCEPKHLNDSPDHCELNKFDDMMSLLASEAADFQQVLAVDRNFDVFTRLWCMAELVQAYLSHIPQRVCLFSEHALDVDNTDLSVYAKLVNLSVLECRATRPEDKEAILAKIPDVHEFDAQVHALIFSERGLLGNRLVGSDILRAAVRSARRVSVALKAAPLKASNHRN